MKPEAHAKHQKKIQEAKAATARAVAAYQAVCDHADVQEFGRYYDGGWRKCVDCELAEDAEYPLGYDETNDYYLVLNDKRGRRVLR